MLQATTELRGFVPGEEVVYVGQERRPRLEPFASAIEVWVEVQLVPTWGDLYLFSCRMPDHTWQMGQVGCGCDFKTRGAAPR